MNKYLVVSPYPPPFMGGHIVYMASVVENCKTGFDILTNALPSGFSEIISKKDKAFRKKWIRSMFKEPTFINHLITYPSILFWIFCKKIISHYELIILNWGVVLNSLVAILGKIIGFTTIILIHGEEITLTLKSKGLKAKFKNFLMKCGFKKADGFIASSHFVRDRAVEMGIDSSLIDIVPVCFNPRNQVQVNLNRKRGYVITSVGTLVERKGFHHLINAIHLLKKDFPEIKVNIVGDGPLKEKLEQQIKELNLENHIIMHGNLFESQLSKIFENTDLFVLANQMMPDGNTEGAPLVIADACSHAIPVIAGTGGGVSTLVLNNKTGFIIDSKNIAELSQKIRQLFSDSQLAIQMGKAGMEKIKKDHNPTNIAQQFENSLNRFNKKAALKYKKMAVND